MGQKGGGEGRSPSKAQGMMVRRETNEVRWVVRDVVNVMER